MRTLFEIVEGAKDGNKPTHEECYFAMLMLSELWHFDRMDVRSLCEAIKERKPSLKVRGEVTVSESFYRCRRALDADPQKWLGDHVPGNLHYERMRELAFKVAEKATGEKLR